MLMHDHAQVQAERELVMSVLCIPSALLFSSSSSSSSSPTPAMRIAPLGCVRSAHRVSCSHFVTVLFPRG
jgi:hypothetical protein